MENEASTPPTMQTIGFPVVPGTLTSPVPPGFNLFGRYVATVAASPVLSDVPCPFCQELLVRPAHVPRDEGAGRIVWHDREQGRLVIDPLPPGVTPLACVVCQVEFYLPG